MREAPPAPPPARSVRANFLASTGAMAGRVLLGFVATVLVTRTLGPVGRGQFSFVLTTLSLLVMLGGAGSFAAVTTAAARHGRTPAQLYPASATFAASIAGVVGGLFLVVYLALSDSLFSGVSGWAAVAVVIALVPTLVLNYWTAVAALDDRLVSFSVGSLVGSALYLLAVVAAAGAGLLTAGNAVMLWVVASLAPLATVVTRRRLQRSPVQRTAKRELLRHAARANLGDVAMLLVLRADVLAVKGLRGYAEVGIYAVATGIAELVLQAGASLRMAFLRRQGQASDRDALVAMLAKCTRLTLACGMVLSALIALTAGPFVRLVFGPTFAGAGLAAAILAPGVLAVAVQGPLRDYLLVEGRSFVPNVTAGTTLVLNIALNLVLLRRHTYLVAAVTSTLAYGINLAACVWCFSRATGTPLRDVLVARRSDLATVRRLLPLGGATP